MNLTWTPVAALLLVTAGWLIFAGVAFRNGRMRQVGSWYFRRELPFYARNFPFAALPSGVGAFLMFAIFPLAVVDVLWVEYLALSLVPAVLACLMVSIAFMLRPPDGLKPRWIRERERQEQGGRPADTDVPPDSGPK